MANEKRLIDANALKVKAFPDPDSGEGIVYVQDIDEAQTVDAVEVVRCNNCKFADPYERMDGLTGYYCMCDKNSFTYGQNWDRRFNPVKESNDFCSYGERRTDG